MHATIIPNRTSATAYFYTTPKVIDGAYKDYSKRRASGASGAYSRYWGGAFLAPGDLGGLSSAYRGISPCWYAMRQTRMWTRRDSKPRSTG